MFKTTLGAPALRSYPPNAGMLSFRRSSTTSEVFVSFRANSSYSRVSGWAVTGVGLLDHILNLLATAAPFSFSVCCRGAEGSDWRSICADVGAALGLAFSSALSRTKAFRYAHETLVAGGSLVDCSLDLCARGRFFAEVPSSAFTGTTTANVVRIFLSSLTRYAGFCLHINVLKSESNALTQRAIFKALGLCLSSALGRPSN
ncbi:MAG: hypothetical protein ACKER6_00085 [Candidatus Hodgkinia cicadicola]